ncbi:MAG: tRNA-dihydrouridine synthase [Clostridiales bacterium]|nr:tRNA-dihydrouridine synthase [Clostridiales bacterium]
MYRTIAHEYGCAYGVTELVSARGIRFKESVEVSMRYLKIDPAREGKTGIQLFGADPDDFAYAIPFILEDPRLCAVDVIDLNMGCPVSKVVKTGAGSALMKDPLLAGRIIEASARAAEKYGKPVTVKFRSGWDEGHITAPEFAKMCVESGAAGLAIHARTQTQMYRGTADWDVIARTKSAIDDTGIPLWGNGDVKDGASAVAMIEETGADGVMVGRAAQGNPWVFSEIRAALAGDAEASTGECGEESKPAGEKCFPVGIVDRKTRAEVIRRHLLGLCDQLGEKTGVNEMRAQIACYLKGGRGTAEIKNRLMTAGTIYEVEALLDEYCSVE